MISHANNRLWNDWKLRQLAFRSFARRENVRRHNRQRGFIINPYAYGGFFGGDPYFSYLVSGLHLDGSNGSTTFTDIKGKTWSRISPGTAEISTTESKFGGASLKPITWGISTPDHSDFDFGSADFTIRFWAYWSFLTSTDGTGVYLISRGRENLLIPYLFFNNTSGFITFFASTDGGSSWNVAPGTTAVSTGGWYFVSISRQGNDWHIHLNGNYQSSDSESGSVYTLSQPLAVGSAYTGGTVAADLRGYIDDVQVYNGVGIYNNSNYSPPSIAFLDY